MKTIKLCTLALSTTLSFVTPTIERIQTVEETMEEPEENTDFLSQVVIDNPYVCYDEIESLLRDDSWQENIEVTHPETGIYQVETNQILWDQALETIKENNKTYLEGHPEMDYLTCFEDHELKEILATHQVFINQMQQEYHLDSEKIACNIRNQEILKDTRLAALEVPYFAIYEASTQTMIFLEDFDLDYYEITKAHEETHLLQGSCIHISSNMTKQSVWEEPIEYVQRGTPSPLRTISLDEYIAYIQSQKINPDYPIDIPEFKLLKLLELSFLANQNYEYQNTLTSLSLNQNREGFYQLFYGNQDGKVEDIHKLMHTIDLCYGYFPEEREQIDCSSEELIRMSLLEINRNFFQNLINCENTYDVETLLSLISLNKEYSLYILDSYMIESENEDKNHISTKYLQDYERLETAFFCDFQNKYPNSNLSLEYQNYNSQRFPIQTSKKNQELIIDMLSDMGDFYQYQNQTEKPLYRVLS